MTQLEKSLEDYLHHHIPLSLAMGVSVDQATLESVTLAASCNKNINHKKTVFGGSLHAVATLACWSLMHVNLAKVFDGNIELVISHSDVDYLAPVNTDFKAFCQRPEKVEWDRFMQMLQRKGKARMNLQATIHQDSKLCVDYKGTFVALKRPGEVESQIDKIHF